MRTKIILLAGIFLLVAVSGAEMPDPIMGTEAYLPSGPVAAFMMKPNVWELDYVGQPEQVGTTWYDYQHNSSMSRMIAYQDDGSVHCCWMNGLVSGASQRVIYYNKRLPDGTWVYGDVGNQVNVTAFAGYCTLDLDVSGNPVIAYHATPQAGGTYSCYVWNSTGEHALPAPPAGVTEITWPHVCVDVRDYIHVVAASNPTNKIYYTRSEDGGATWIDWQEVVTVGTSSGVSQTVCSDLATGKVAIGWTKPVTTSLYQSDVWYVESSDGTTWNFAGAVNITQFGAGVHPMSSSTRAYADLNILYDSNGDIHIAYTSVPYPTYGDPGMIWHWSEATGHQKVTGTFEETSWISFNDPGAWRQCIDRPSLSEDADGVLYCQWGQCTTPGDSSAGGYGNWDVYVTYSTDGGYNWMAPVNVTGTATPGAPPGQCFSENWANMAKVATDKLHLQYIFDLDAGGIPQGEGTWTLNPVFYQGVPIDSILTNMVVTLEPVNPPIIIPPGGGSFQYELTIENQCDFTVHFDGWIDVILPNSSIYDILARYGITLPSGGSITRTMTQNVPGGAPAGTYTYQAHTGDKGWNVWGEASFNFTKSAVDGSAGGSWACSGWDEGVKVVEATPETHVLSSVYPNPFNPTTAISYQLPATSFVNLTVYDIYGRRIAELVNGWRDAGVHRIVFDGSNLTSGVYLYRLDAGDASASGKMVLMK